MTLYFGHQEIHRNMATWCFCLLWDPPTFNTRCKFWQNYKRSLRLTTLVSWGIMVLSNNHCQVVKKLSMEINDWSVNYSTLTITIKGKTENTCKLLEGMIKKSSLSLGARTTSPPQKRCIILVSTGLIFLQFLLTSLMHLKLDVLLTQFTCWINMK